MALINKVLPGYVATLWCQEGANPTALTDTELATWANVETIIGTSAGGLGTTYTVRVMRSPLRKPQAIGGRLALPGSHTVFEFWKATSTSAADPRPGDLITVDSVVFVVDSVEDTRRSKWILGATKTKTNVPAV